MAGRKETLQPSQISPQQDAYQKMPKVDLHRHLEGSVRLQTLRELSKESNPDSPGTGELSARVQVQSEDSYTFVNFLSKFQVLREFYRSKEIIQRIAYEAIADAAADNVRYLELRFAPVALSRIKSFPLADVMDWVIASVERASHEHSIATRLIATVNRHESIEEAETVMKLAAERIRHGIVALDLAGNEAQYDARPFIKTIREARDKGLALTIHAGEWSGPENVRQAIEEIGAGRIGHGVRVIEDPRVVELARSGGVAFEVCVTSNYQSGVVTNLTEHPVRKMLDAGLNVTLNTDDPSISRITLSDEYRLVSETFGFDQSMLAQCIITAAQAAFLPVEEKARLIEQLTAELAVCNAYPRHQ